MVAVKVKLTACVVGGAKTVLEGTATFRVIAPPPLMATLPE